MKAPPPERGAQTTGLHHELVAASAGFGKTHRLASRLIALFVDTSAAPVRADAVAALTFSRAAAGEIFDTVVRRLASAARDEDGLAWEIGQNSELDGQTPLAAMRGALRGLLAEMHTAFIGTIDGFFLRTLQAFAPDLGVTGDIAMLDEHELATVQEDLLRAILATQEGRAARSGLAEAFKDASSGNEAKTVSDTIAELTSTWHDLFLRAPAAERWGEPNAIWQGRSQWLFDSLPSIDDTIGALRASLADSGQSEKQLAKWEELFDQARSFTPTSRVPLGTGSLFWKLLEVAEDLAAGHAVLTNFRKTDLSPDTCRHALELVRHIMNCELRNRLRATRGIRELLARYEDVYQRRLRRQGRLVFDDVPALLAGRATTPLEQWEPQSADLAMAHLNYRLDGRLDHWALDEFQDTSRRQWAILHDLVEEVLHGAPPARSFFAVGDVKQAIYGWRGGDVRLMSDLRSHYATGPDAPLRTSQLPRSYRSSQSVLDFVNTVFENPDGWPARVPCAARERWREPGVWCRHEAARDKRGFACLLQTQRAERGSGEPDPRHLCAAAVLADLAPTRNGLSVAVLVRSNHHGAEITRFLREQGIDARWDGDALIADNPDVAALLATLRAAAHPADTLAARHRDMTPLAARLGKAAEPRSLLRTVEERGFEAVVAQLVQALRDQGELNDFAAFRFRQIRDAAQRFDAAGTTDVLDFVRFVESFTVRDLPPECGVRVMTLHRSKGLGFDAVILPDLDDARIDDLNRHEGISACTDEGDPERIRWFLDLPPRAICEADPVLAEHRHRLVDDNAFEALCLLYVGMTRAKQGLVVLTNKPGPSSKTVTMGSFLQHTSTGAGQGRGALDEIPGLPEHQVLYANGDVGWHRKRTDTAPPVSPVVTPLPAFADSARSRSVPQHRRRLPSAPAHEVPAATLLARRNAAATGFGTLIHALFEQLSWLDEEPLDHVVARWRTNHPDAPTDLLERAERDVRNCLNAPSVRRLFTRPDGPVDVRREQPFELLLDGRWVSGVFDRVVLRGDGGGGEWQAEIVDFKSDRVNDDASLSRAVESHRPQMQLYRKALARITGIPRERVSAILLFTGVRTIVNTVPTE